MALHCVSGGDIMFDEGPDATGVPRLRYQEITQNRAAIGQHLIWPERWMLARMSPAVLNVSIRCGCSRMRARSPNSRSARKASLTGHDERPPQWS
jgi:hypothetical protein